MLLNFQQLTQVPYHCFLLGYFLFSSYILQTLSLFIVFYHKPCRNYTLLIYSLIPSYAQQLTYIPLINPTVF
jgi:hypothetical protein